eukprot:9707796-Alexandrium_andersonii.AAC.1
MVRNGPTDNDGVGWVESLVQHARRTQGELAQGVLDVNLVDVWYAVAVAADVLLAAPLPCAVACPTGGGAG